MNSSENPVFAQDPRASSVDAASSVPVSPAFSDEEIGRAQVVDIKKEIDVLVSKDPVSFMTALKMNGKSALQYFYGLDVKYCSDYSSSLIHDFISEAVNVQNFALIDSLIEHNSLEFLVRVVIDQDDEASLCTLLSEDGPLNFMYTLSIGDKSFLAYALESKRDECYGYLAELASVVVHDALRGGNFDTIRHMLVHNGASVVGLLKDNEGTNILHYAISFKQSALIRDLFALCSIHDVGRSCLKEWLQECGMAVMQDAADVVQCIFPPVSIVPQRPVPVDPLHLTFQDVETRRLLASVESVIKGEEDFSVFREAVASLLTMRKENINEILSKLIDYDYMIGIYYLNSVYPHIQGKPDVYGYEVVDYMLLQGRYRAAEVLCGCSKEDIISAQLDPIDLATIERIERKESKEWIRHFAKTLSIRYAFLDKKVDMSSGDSEFLNWLTRCDVSSYNDLIYFVKLL